MIKCWLLTHEDLHAIPSTNVKVRCSSRDKSQITIHTSNASLEIQEANP